MPKALLIVDVQNDFLPGGALAVPDGDEVTSRINELIAREPADFVIATRDWHPPDHHSFKSQGGPWPEHCVAHTEGAQITEGIPRQEIDGVIDKGDEPDVEGYSAFQETELETLLRSHEIGALTLTGLATDYCVRHSALDALRSGFDVTIDRAGVRGIDAAPGDSERALAEIADAGGQIR